MKLINQMRRNCTRQASYNVARKCRIARNGLGNAELVAGQQSPDIDLIGARKYVIVNSIGTKKSPLVAEVVINTQHPVIFPFWKGQRRAVPLRVQRVPTV